MSSVWAEARADVVLCSATQRAILQRPAATGVWQRVKLIAARLASFRECNSAAIGQRGKWPAGVVSWYASSNTALSCQDRPNLLNGKVDVGLHKHTQSRRSVDMDLTSCRCCTSVLEPPFVRLEQSRAHRVIAAMQPLQRRFFAARTCRPFDDDLCARNIPRHRLTRRFHDSPPGNSGTPCAGTAGWLTPALHSTAVALSLSRGVSSRASIGRFAE